MRPGSSVAEPAPKTEFNTSISGGIFGAAQFGDNNTARVENVGSAIHQQFQELRELANSAPISELEREKVLGHIAQLEEVAESGNATNFEALKNSFMGGFANKLGNEAALKLVALSPLISDLGGSF